MGMDEDNVKVFPANWGGMASKPCDSCKSAAAILFCRPDSAFLCMGCDSKIHGANKLASRHERVWMCEVCEQAPAAVTCKADAAALCVTCDSDIHSANPLARRHDRVPVEPFYDSAESLVKSSSSTTISAAANTAVNFLVPTIDENEAASWLLPNPNVNTKLADTTDVVKTGGGGDMFFSDFDHLLEFDYINSMNGNLKQQHQHQHQQHTHGSNADSVVPVQQQIMNNNHNLNHNHNHHHPTETCFDIDFCKSKLTPYNYTTTQSSLSHSISSSELEVGIVPDGTSVVSDTSYTFGKQMNSSNGNGNGGVVDQLSGMDREARVLRYREKRKNRKFEKTIRYASRKAYAETRPRIKGRFAKRTETETDTDIDQMFIPVRSAGFMADSGYGVVPSF